MSDKPKDFAYWIPRIEKHKVFVFVGAKKTGKTTKLLQFVKNRLYFDKAGNRLPARSLWFTYSTDPVYDNFAPIDYRYIDKFSRGNPKLNVDIQDPKLKIKDTKEAINFYFQKLQNFKNGTLVLDDAASLFGYGLNENFRKIMTNSRHSNIDTVLVFHSLDQIPKFIFASINYIVLFKTSFEPDKNRLKGLNNYPALMEAHDRAQKSPNKFYWEFVEII
jgi:hypothetical protein